MTPDIIVRGTSEMLLDVQVYLIKEEIRLVRSMSY